MRYKTGDRVRITFGHIYWQAGINRATGKDEIMFKDMRPEWVGKGATIVDGHTTQGIEYYSLNIDDIGRVSWFQLKQLVPEPVWERAIRQRHRRPSPLGGPPGLRKYRQYPLTFRECHRPTK